jgi:hypothetical protein
MNGAAPVCPKLDALSGKQPMAKPNYSFEKKQRELAKKKKQDEKLAKKQATREPGQSDGTPPAGSGPSSGGR